jgi:hypothetical protein
MTDAGAAKAARPRRALQSVTPSTTKEVKPTVDPDLELLKECSKHIIEGSTAVDKNGKPKLDDKGKPLPKHLLYFEDGQKPSEVLKEAVDVVVSENNQRLAAGGFHKDLIFRSGKDSGQFVTLAQDDDGTVMVKPLTSVGISMALQSRFCYLAGKKKETHKPMPGWFAGALNYGDTEYRFPILNGLLNHPAIHLDGTVVATEGYDPGTKCWVVAGWDDLKAPANPTPKQVVEAVETLREPFEEVIFAGDKVVDASPVKGKGVDMVASEANALGLVLTPLVRSLLTTAPFFIITSSQWGTAKGLVATTASIVAQDSAPLLTDMKISPDQMEKNVDRVLHDHPGAKIIQFDEPQDSNSGGRFHSRKLALLATTDKYVNRPVYGRAAVSVDTRRTMIFTGINIRPDQDMVRRVCFIELALPDDGTLPHEREFKHADRNDKVKLQLWVSANRRRFIEAVITLVNAWRVADCPLADFSFDFPEWVHTVGGILQNAGITTWMANRNDVYANADEALKTAFVLGLVKATGVGPFTSRELVVQVLNHPDKEELQDMLTWNDPWAAKLHTAWGDATAMTYALGRMLGGLKDRLLADGNGGRVTVSSYNTDGKLKWMFSTPSQTAVKPQPGGQPKS